MYLPWTLTSTAQKIPYQFALAYAVLAGTLMLLAFTRGAREPVPDEK